MPAAAAPVKWKGKPNSEKEVYLLMVYALWQREKQRHEKRWKSEEYEAKDWLRDAKLLLGRERWKSEEYEAKEWLRDAKLLLGWDEEVKNMKPRNDSGTRSCCYHESCENLLKITAKRRKGIVRDFSNTKLEHLNKNNTKVNNIKSERKAGPENMIKYQEMIPET